MSGMKVAAPIEKAMGTPSISKTKKVEMRVGSKTELLQSTNGCSLTGIGSPRFQIVQPSRKVSKSISTPPMGMAT
jgi:hypothetical protein